MEDSFFDIELIPFADDRTEVQKKIDEITDDYCRQFDTVSYRDQYCVDDEQVYRLMTLSMEDGVDYLSPFSYSTEEGDEREGDFLSPMIQSIRSEGSDASAHILAQAFEQLGLRRFRADQSYAVLSYIAHRLQNGQGTAESNAKRLVKRLGALPREDLLVLVKPYAWEPEQLGQLRALRETIQKRAVDKYNGAEPEKAWEGPSPDQEAQRLEKAIFVTYNGYGNRANILEETNFLVSEIQKDWNYLASNEEEPDLSIGLQQAVSDTPLFEDWSFSSEHGLEEFRHPKFHFD